MRHMNGGILGKKLDLSSTTRYLTTSTGSKISYVGGTTAAFAGDASVTTSVNLLNLSGGSDSRPLENDVVVATFSVGGQVSIDPGAYSSTGTATTDSWCAATIALRPSGTISYVGGKTATITSSLSTTTSVSLTDLTGGSNSSPSQNDIVIVGYSIGSAVSRTAQFSISGYTTLASLTVADTYDGNLGVFYKIMSASPDTTVTIPATGLVGDSGAVTIQVFRNVDTAANGRRPDPIAITVITENAWIVVIGGSSHVAGSTETFTAPTGYTTNFLTLATNETVDTTIGSGYRSTAVTVAADGVYPTTPTGYTNIARIGTMDTYSAGLNVSYKVMSATPDSTFTAPATLNTQWAGAVAIQVWRYVDTTTPMDVTATTSNSTSSRQPDPPSITPTTSGAVILACGGAAHTGSETAVFTNTGLDNFLTLGSNDTYDTTVGMYSAMWTSGAYDPTAFTTAVSQTTDSAAAVTLVLRPQTNVPLANVSNYTYSGIWNLRANMLNKAVETDVSRIVNYSTAFTTSAATSVNIVLPAFIKRNDLILIFAGNDNTTDTAQFDNSTHKPTGFTFIKTAGDSVADVHCAAFYKVANGSESETTLNVPAQSSFNMWAVALIVRGALVSSPVGNLGTANTVDVLTTSYIPGLITTKEHSIVFTTASFDGTDTIPYNISSNTGLWLNKNTIQVGVGGATGTGGLVAWNQLTANQSSSESVTIAYSASDGAAGFQFEIKSSL
jgi:hypothetical protein